MGAARGGQSLPERPLGGLVRVDQLRLDTRPGQRDRRAGPGGPGAQDGGVHGPAYWSAPRPRIRPRGSDRCCSADEESRRRLYRGGPPASAPRVAGPVAGGVDSGTAGGGCSDSIHCRQSCCSSSVNTSYMGPVDQELRQQRAVVRAAGDDELLFHQHVQQVRWIVEEVVAHALRRTGAVVQTAVLRLPLDHLQHPRADVGAIRLRIQLRLQVVAEGARPRGTPRSRPRCAAIVPAAARP